MSKSPWGNVHSWAAEAEAAEREEAAAAAAAAAAGGDSQNFPSLREAATAKPKKKAPTKMSLQDFNTLGQEPYRAAGAGSRLTAEEMLYLPTGPRERSAEEMQSGRLGGGFSNYGSRFAGQQSGRGRDRDGDGEGSWANNRRPYGGFDDDRRGPPPRASDFDQPSRADEVDNWASTKKPLPSYDSTSIPATAAHSRYAMLGAGGGASRADGDDNWAASKRHIAPPPPTRSSTFGSEFRDSRSETDRWTRGGSQRLVLDSPKSEQGTDNASEVPVKVNKPNPFGAARPREEVLAEKGLDWKKMDIEIEAKKGSSRPTSSQSSRPQSSESARSDGQVLQGVVEGTVKPKVKVNPFGNAKPREVLLEEKGLDWRKIDLELEHGRVNRLETDEEKNLKKEIEQLKEEAHQNPGEGHIHDLISKKEKELEVLTSDLDDKARFGEKASERPGSSSSSSSRVHDRPRSRPGSVDEHRSGEFMDSRPRSRGRGGGGDTWYGRVDDRRRAVQQGGGWPGDDRRATQDARQTVDIRSFQGAARPGDDRRFVQGGGRDGRFFGNRNMDRSRSDRWQTPTAVDSLL